MPRLPEPSPQRPGRIESGPLRATVNRQQLLRSVERITGGSYHSLMTDKAPSPRRKKTARKLGVGEYTVDELAQRTRTTVRNIRAYQDKGVLPPPEKRGRLGVYGDRHISRLKLINNLLDRGFSTSNIIELTNAWLDGRDLGDILGLEHALTNAFSSEPPRYFSLPELLKMFGLGAAKKSLIEDAVELNLLKRKGLKFIAESPSLVEAGAELVKLGMPFDELMDLLRLLRGNVQRAAENLVEVAFLRFDTFGDELPANDEIQQLSELIWKLRPIAHTAIRAEAELALNRAVQARLGDRLVSTLQNLQHGNPARHD